MISIDEFEILLQEVADFLPDIFFDELNGGILLLPEVKYHPKARNMDLFVLGEYHYDSIYGRYISIYYGSFNSVYGWLSREQLKEKLEETVKHEFRHHLESKSGISDLEKLDKKQIEDYERRAKKISRQNK